MAGTSIQTAIGDNKFYVDSGVAKVETNYVATDSGTSNALACALTDINGGSIALAAGLSIRLLTANDITKGTATTFTLNGGSAKVLGAQSRPGNNLATTLVAGAIIDIIYDGTQWQCVGY